MLFDPRLPGVVGICMIMRMTWNSPISLPFFGKYVIPGFAAWLLVLGLIQSGLQQIREAQSLVAPAEASSHAPPQQGNKPPVFRRPGP